MTAYIGLIHKEQESAFGVSFPDLPGHITAGKTLNEAMERAQELLGLILATWEEDSGEQPPEPRSLDSLVNRLAKQTPYRRPKLTPMLRVTNDYLSARLSWSGLLCRAER